MARSMWWSLCLGAVACTSGADDTGEQETFLVQGTIVTAQGDTGHVRIRKAFGMATNGQGGVYLSSNGEATCDRVVEYLQTHSDPFNPSDMLLGGHCNLSYSFSYDDDAGYDGATFSADDMTSIWSINCAMDDGDFVLETRKGFKDYYWSGRWWQGDPTLYTAHVSGDRDSQSLILDLDMSEYTGNFIYEELAEVLADGSVVTPEPLEVRWCPDLVHTSLFSF